METIFLSLNYIQFEEANVSAFEATFLPLSIREEGVFTIPETVNLISKIVEKYYKFPTISTGRYRHVNELQEPTVLIPPVELTIVQYKNLSGEFWRLPCPDWQPPTTNGTNSVNITAMLDLVSFPPERSKIKKKDLQGDFTKITTTYELTAKDPLGPFGMNLSSCELQEFFYSILSISLSFSYESVSVGTFTLIPYVWNIRIDLISRIGMLIPYISILHSLKSNSVVVMISSILMCIISFITSILCVGTVINNIAVYRRVRKRHHSLQQYARPGDLYPTWKSIPTKGKLLFFNLWDVVLCIGCILIFISTIRLFVEQFLKILSYLFLTSFGLGSMLIFANLLRYFKHVPQLYLHVLTLRKALVHVSAYLLSASPIFLAFAIFGVINFGPYSERFDSVGKTFVTLFSLLNGDDIYATFLTIEDGQFPFIGISRVYFFLFETLFITTVLNVFIFIIEDSYRTAKLFILDDAENVDRSHVSLHNAESIPSREILLRLFREMEIWVERSFASQDISFDDDYAATLPSDSPSSPSLPSDQNRNNINGGDNNDNNGSSNGSNDNNGRNGSNGSNDDDDKVKEALVSRSSSALSQIELFRSFSTAVYDENANFVDDFSQKKAQRYNSLVALKEFSPVPPSSLLTLSSSSTHLRSTSPIMLQIERLEELKRVQEIEFQRLIEMKDHEIQFLQQKYEKLAHLLQTLCTSHPL